MDAAPLDTTDRAAALDVHAIGADLREAYERGRRDEKSTRRRHPLGMGITFVLAAIGLVLLVIAGLNGSFTAGGTVVDNSLSIAADQAHAQLADATR